MSLIEPGDLAFIAAALIAGIYTRLSSLNSRDSEFVKIKSEWMESFRVDISDFCEICITAAYLKVVISEKIDLLGESLAEDEGLLNDIDTLEAKLFEKSVEYHKKRTVLRTKLKSSKDLQFRILHRVECIKDNLKISNEKYSSDDRKKAKDIIEDIIRLASNFSESEWDSFKKGDSYLGGEINKQRKNIKRVIGFYVLYIVAFYIFNEDAKQVRVPCDNEVIDVSECIDIN
ncbi:hypothetical protein [Halovibrio sp. HP20-50]|uniref:hypothetical protein n=1 Tax=Halovibrio sp. HP20-59 TaxID=3080275 RepID=UPI00294B0138|nr:hypothetical protein [Halovibrio sp. HP20-59]MEA2119791.1 hypothetical protein [Halovibrio sp. HP20-59]